MAKIYSQLTCLFTRPVICTGLVFFLAVLYSCKAPRQEISIGRDSDDRAVSILIPEGLLSNADSTVHVQLVTGSGRQDVLGELSKESGTVVFKPLVPLTPGLTYAIRDGNMLVGTLTVPAPSGENPFVVAVYPSQDILPENLLKFYIQFSHPMRSGESRTHVVLLDNKQDTLNNMFLDLQPELWDTTNTVLTLWLDPGRIKRDLGPNLALGSPLKQGKKYTLCVSAAWKDTRGMPLAASFKRQFTAGPRDSRSPDLHTWKLARPTAGTREAVTIRFPEALDHFLLGETIRILDKDGRAIKGTAHTGSHDQLFTFTPGSAWTAATYTLQVSARLEDQAGNNLNRLFDRDITREARRDKNVYERTFSLR